MPLRKLSGASRASGKFECSGGCTLDSQIDAPEKSATVDMTVVAQVSYLGADIAGYQLANGSRSWLGRRLVAEQSALDLGYISLAVGGPARDSHFAALKGDSRFQALVEENQRNLEGARKRPIVD
jgi:hypothetical protein